MSTNQLREIIKRYKEKKENDAIANKKKVVISILPGLQIVL
jgi:hypothetical protein